MIIIYIYIYIYIYYIIKSDSLHITLTGYNKFTKDIVDPKIKHEKFATKDDMADLVKKNR